MNFSSKHGFKECHVGSCTDYSIGGDILETIDGFTFLEGEDLCGKG